MHYSKFLQLGFGCKTAVENRLPGFVMLFFSKLKNYFCGYAIFLIVIVLLLIYAVSSLYWASVLD